MEPLDPGGIEPSREGAPMTGSGMKLSTLELHELYGFCNLTARSPKLSNQHVKLSPKYPNSRPLMAPKGCSILNSRSLGGPGLGFTDHGFCGPSMPTFGKGDVNRTSLGFGPEESKPFLKPAYIDSKRMYALFRGAEWF